jgi:hypothetical protein
VWYGSDGANWQIFTRKIGVDAATVHLTSAVYNQSYPQVSGDRVVWRGYNGTNWQIYRAKLLTTPIIARSPNKNFITAKRAGKKRLARYTLAATMRDRDGTLAGGATIYLQTSKNGRTNWKMAYKLKTNAFGQVSKSFSTRKKGSLYFRWYTPAATGYNRAYGAKQRVQVK